MFIRAEGGTDGANIVLFFPGNLPANGDKLLQDDPISLIEELERNGDLIWFPCEGDGSYSLGLYVNEESGIEANAEIKEKRPIELLRVPDEQGGQGYFGGYEYMFKNDDSSLQEYPHQMQMVEIPPGHYTGTLFELDPFDQARAEFLAEHTSTWAYRLYCSQGWFLGLGLAAFAVLPFLWCAGQMLASLIGLLVSLALVATSEWIRRSKPFRGAQAVAEQFDYDHPSYVVELRSK